MTNEELTKALKRAYNLGQIYWQQADSEYTSQHKKADVTEAAFKELIETTVAALEAKDEPVQVSPLEFVEMVMEKEHLVGKPIFWAEWPNKGEAHEQK